MDSRAGPRLPTSHPVQGLLRGRCGDQVRDSHKDPSSLPLSKDSEQPSCHLEAVASTYPGTLNSHALSPAQGTLTWFQGAGQCNLWGRHCC